MGQKAGVLGERRSQKWTAEAVSQPTIPKSDRLLAVIVNIPAIRDLTSTWAVPPAGHVALMDMPPTPDRTASSVIATADLHHPG